MQAWMMVLVSGPGAIAGVAILFGEFANEAVGGGAGNAQLVWAVSAILFFALINLRGAEWGGGTQIAITAVKVAGLLALVAGGIFLAAAAEPTPPESAVGGEGLLGLLRFMGLGIALVLFTYDGWIDASNVAGEVRDPNRNFPIAMGLGVISITAIYLVVNYAFLRVVPLAAMQAEPALVASRVAEAAFGPVGGRALDFLMWISIFGAIGGLVMTLPRLFFAAASEYRERALGTLASPFFRTLSWVTPGTGVPAGAILFAATMAIVALLFFGSFSRIVTFFVVPFQFMNILLVASIFRLRKRIGSPDSYRLPGYPYVPLLFMAVMAFFLLSALYYNPLDSVIGILLTLAGIPVYLGLRGRGGS
jgi:APA family basic amino acid/polyamine antiporter